MSIKESDRTAVGVDIHTILRARRSVRRFKTDLIPAPVIQRIIETATYAPSAHNLQPWRFAVVTSSVVRTRLGQALTAKMVADMNAAGAPESEIEMRLRRSMRRLNEAPVVILHCRDVTDIRQDEPEEITMAVQSVAACGLQLLLAAHAEGLGGNWICWPLYAQEAAREALELPDTWEPQGMFILGYADEEPKEKVLKPLQEVIRFI
jgi:coenzyme F420-0:L-glutamate ligase / coenzyme F420-1:gamma-L-glutamate ligase